MFIYITCFFFFFIDIYIYIYHIYIYSIYSTGLYMIIHVCILQRKRNDVRTGLNRHNLSTVPADLQTAQELDMLKLPKISLQLFFTLKTEYQNTTRKKSTEGKAALNTERTHCHLLKGAVGLSIFDRPPTIPCLCLEEQPGQNHL